MGDDYRSASSKAVDIATPQVDGQMFTAVLNIYIVDLQLSVDEVVMHVLRILVRLNFAAIVIGGLATLLLVWLNNHPTEPKMWYAGVVEWQGHFWSCVGFVWFVICCAAVNGSSVSAGDPCSDEMDLFATPTTPSSFGVHPTTGNITSNGVDCDGNMSGNFPSSFD